jgi:hypothetical protein
MCIFFFVVPFFNIKICLVLLKKKQLLLFVDMENDEPINSLQEDLLFRLPSLTIKDRIKNFLGLPKSIHGEYVDNEQYSWRM